MPLKIIYITSEKLLKQCDKIPVIKKRASMVHALICAYELDKKMEICESRIALEYELSLFHSMLYIEFLKKQIPKNSINNNSNNNKNMLSEVNRSDSDSESLSDSDDIDDEHLEYGLGYDCPKISNLWEFILTIAGSTLTSVESILNGANIVINWCGGWHHAQRDEARGFCYINDIVIGIQKLRENFQRVLYIDLDIHHGDGVENAFIFTKRVFTLSFHQYECGFYPGTGTINDCGLGNGRGYSANFPYKRYVNGEIFRKYFQKVTELIKNKYKPNVCVIQCGGDVIVNDPLGGTNITPNDMGQCIEEILKWNLPVIFLGGGGYNLSNTSRYWTYLTSIICNNTLADDIPDNEYFLDYGPDYEINIVAKNLTDLNTDADFEKQFQKIQETNAQSTIQQKVKRKT